MVDVVALTQDLIRCPSVTPEDAGAQDVLIRVLEPLGFTCTKLRYGAVDNLFARRGNAGPHLCFAGHTDVVPPGDDALWSSPPFAANIVDGQVIGRGAADMKGNIAAFIAALAAFPAGKGSVSLLITGDEEGPAIDGTVKVLGWMKENGHIPDACIVGEPTNPERLGDEIKIGRRGSLSGLLTAHGIQGHVAYPHRADNPIPKLARMIDALASLELDQGSEFFDASTLQFSNVHVGNTADNVIPAAASARFNVRFNDLWTPEALEAELRATLDLTGENYALETTCGARSFITPPGPFTDLVRDAVATATGRVPAITTSGGTSDARFIREYCPVVECGLINKTIHKVDEGAAVDDLRKLEAVYRAVLERFFASVS